MNKQLPHFNEGEPGVIVGLVFSCPGRCETELGRPVAGTTGDNLDYIIKRLHQKFSEIFKYPNKYDYRITNASKNPHYSKLGNGTKPNCFGNYRTTGSDTRGIVRYEICGCIWEKRAESV